MMFSYGTLAVVLAAIVDAAAPLPTYQPGKTIEITTNDYNKGADCKYPGGSIHLDFKQIYEFGQIYGNPEIADDDKYGRYIASARGSRLSHWVNYVQTEFVFGYPDPNTPGALPTYTLWDVFTMINGVKVSRCLLFGSFN